MCDLNCSTILSASLNQEREELLKILSFDVGRRGDRTSLKIRKARYEPREASLLKAESFSSVKEACIW